MFARRRGLVIAPGGCSTLAGMAKQILSLNSDTIPKSSEEIERCVIASFQIAESLGFKGDFRQWEAQLEDARRTLGIVALALALSMGNTIPQGVSPAVTKTEAFAVVGVDVDRAIVVDVISASASATMLVDAFGEQRDLNVCAARVGKKSFASDGLASPGERIWETAR